MPSKSSPPTEATPAAASLAQTPNVLHAVHLHGAVDTARMLAGLDSLDAACEALRLGLDGTTALSPRTHQLVDLADDPNPQEAFEQLCAHIAWGKLAPCTNHLVQLAPDHVVWLLCHQGMALDSDSYPQLWQYLAASYERQRLPQFATVAQQLDPAGAENSEETSRRQAFFSERLSSGVETMRFYHGSEPASPAILRKKFRLGESLAHAVTRHVQSSPAQGGPTEAELEQLFLSALAATLHRLGANRQQAIGVQWRKPASSALNSALCIGNRTYRVPLRVEVLSTDSFADLSEKLADDREAVRAHWPVDFTDVSTSADPSFEVTCDVRLSQALALSDVKTTVDTTTAAHFFCPTGCGHELGGRNGASTEADMPSERVPALAVTVVATPDGREYEVQLDCSSQRFSRGDTARFAHHFQQMLQAATHDFEEAIGNALLVDDRELQELLAFNPKDTPVGPDVISAFEQVVSRNPQAMALRFDSRNLTYVELNQQANQLAAGLSCHGVTAGDWVAVLLERGVDLVATLLACLKLGAAYVPLDPSHPTSRNALVLDVAKPKIVVAEPSAAAALCSEGQSEPLSVKQLLDATSGRAPNPSAPDAVGGLIAYVIFTSGSTGKPKGVQVQRSALANFLGAMAHQPGFGEGEGLLSVTTISFDIAGLEIFLPLSQGGWLEMVDRLTALNPKALMSRLDSGEFQLLQATPATWRMLLEAGWTGTPGLKALCGGEALPKALADQLCARTGELWNMYGPTETTVWSTVQRVQSTERGISIGRPIANTQVYILDAQQHIVPQGVVGELTIGGQGVTLGYAGLPELTAEKFLRDPFHSSPEARMYRTGDLGRYCADGTLECLGRVDFQVKIRGFRIELGEIEAAIAKHGSLPEALVVARELTPGDPRLIAYGKRAEGFDSQTLRAFLLELLPSYMVPSFFIALEQWPLTPNGKIDRKALPAPDEKDRVASNADRVPPANDLERRIADVWCATLNCPAIGRNENLFATGATSLDAIRLLTALASLPEGEVALGNFLQDPTVAGIASALNSNSGKDEPVVLSLNEVPASKERPALFCVCGIHLYSELAYSMGDYPVFGVYLPIEREILNIDESKPGEQLPSVEDIAAAYIEVIRQHQAHGPYLLAGVSFGGVLAFEMAQQLRQEDQQVAVLGILDSLLSNAYHFHLGSWVGGHLQQVRKQGPGYVLDRPAVATRLAKVPALQRTVHQVLRRSQSNEPLPASSPSVSAQEQPESDTLREEQLRIFELLVKRYEPRMTTRPGDALFFRAMHDEQFGGYRIDGDGGWSRWIEGRLHQHNIPGDHLGILQGRSAELIGARLLEAIHAELPSSCQKESKKQAS